MAPSIKILATSTVEIDSYCQVNNNTSPRYFLVQSAYPNPVYGSRSKLLKNTKMLTG